MKRRFLIFHVWNCLVDVIYYSWRVILICILLNCFIYSEYYYKEWLDDYFYTPYKLFHSKDLLSHICKVLVPFMVFSRCEAPVKEGKSISKIIQTIWMYLMMRSKTCRVPWIKKHTAPAVNRDASSELPKTVHIFPEVKLHTFPEVYIFLYFF